MKNLNVIKVNRRLVSSVPDFDIHKGAIFNLEELRHNPLLVKFLCDEHFNNPYSIVGHIGELYRIRNQILFLEKYGDMTYREYLQEMIRKGLYSLPQQNR
ncbi:MAG: hypothetical protein GKR88_12930 [Flavobacteriaceae bacterium]|nr:MAG: hypothetical protein GKR88_12930 [Flavobacteriaceae bacterium]